jgi:hypothetical protein
LTNATYEVRVLSAVAWSLLRQTRLWAIKDSPKAFTPEDDEPRWSPREWVETFEDSVLLVARAGSDVVGLLRSKPAPDRLWSRYVESALGRAGPS